MSSWTVISTYPPINGRAVTVRREFDTYSVAAQFAVRSERVVGVSCDILTTEEIRNMDASADGSYQVLAEVYNSGHGIYGVFDVEEWVRDYFEPTYADTNSHPLARYGDLPCYGYLAGWLNPDGSIVGVFGHCNLSGQYQSNWACGRARLVIDEGQVTAEIRPNYAKLTEDQSSALHKLAELTGTNRGYVNNTEYGAYSDLSLAEAIEMAMAETERSYY